MRDERGPVERLLPRREQNAIGSAGELGNQRRGRGFIQSHAGARAGREPLDEAPSSPSLEVPALAAARSACRRLDSIASTPGAASTTASICLQKSASPLAARSSASCGWILLKVP